MLGDRYNFDSQFQDYYLLKIENDKLGLSLVKLSRSWE